MHEKAAAFARTDVKVAAMIAGLREQGLSLGVISNCLAEDMHAWPTWPLARAFHCSVFSHAEGMAKPDPQIYVRATRRLGVDPSATVFIGDGGDDELAGAEQAGCLALRAEWFSTTGRLPRSRSDRSGLVTPQDVLNRLAAGHPFT